MAKSFREAVLRDRLAYLERQVAATKKQLQPYEAEQAELLGGKPAAPARKLSAQQEDHAEWKAARGTRLEELGVDVVDEPDPPVAFINVKMKEVRDRCAALATSTRTVDDVLEKVIDRFLDLDWPAKFEPAYPFNAFASREKGYGAVLEQLGREWQVTR